MSHKHQQRSAPWQTQVVRLVSVWALLASTISFAANTPGRNNGRSARLSHISAELSKLSTEQQQGKVRDQRIRVIVQFTQKPTNFHIRKMNGFGGQHLKALSLVKGGVFTIPVSALAKLEQDPDIAYISPHR